MIIEENSLAYKFSELVEEWHPMKNGELTPYDVLPGSGKKVWWLCKNGHEWETTISNRTGNKSGCPFCSGKRAWSGFNDLQTINPKLAREWHPTKNSDLTPRMVTSRSDKKVWWRCDNGHEWEATIKDRQHGNGCPYCSGRLPVSGETDLATVFPNIAKQWHPTKNGNLTPSQITARSNKKVWWKCEKGHEWYATVDSRSKTICPICTGRKVLEGYNDLTTTHPAIAIQWHPTKNGKLTPQMITHGSTKKVWWRCEKGHEWYVSPNARTNHENGTLTNCPTCSSELKTSFPEQAVLYYLCSVTTAVSRDVSFGKELDIWLPNLQTGIEYDGIYYHANSKRDIEKIFYFAKKNIRIISIKESNRNVVFDNTIEYDYREKKQLDWAISELFNLLEINAPRIDTDADLLHIQEQYVQMEKNNSIVAKYPHIAEEWHPNKNGTLKPEMYSFSSHAKVWWLGKCGHEWMQVIKNRTLSNAGCPICSGKEVLTGFNDLATKNPEVVSLWHPKKNGNLTPEKVASRSGKKVWWQCEKGHEWQTAISGVSAGSRCPICSNRVVLAGFNDLTTTHPQIAAEWHPTLNGDLKPQEVSKGSTKRVWWKCAGGHEWQTTPNSRTNSGSGCPVCVRQKK